MMKEDLIMETEITIKPTFEVNGTSFIGHVKISYEKLVSVFGKEHLGESADAKILCEWAFEFPDKTVATIYNYKTGKNYDPVDGLDKEDIDMWHIGGKDEKAFHYIRLLLWGKAKAGGLGYPPPLYL
tara:strand:+ start:1740 stop:2120 length:381 start_codon:yes stop_codon:yes gene_type:complete